MNAKYVEKRRAQSSCSSTMRITYRSYPQHGGQQRADEIIFEIFPSISYRPSAILPPPIFQSRTDVYSIITLPVTDLACNEVQNAKNRKINYGNYK